MAALALAGSVAVASAEQFGAWQVDWTTAPDGTRVHAASLYAELTIDPDEELTEEPVTLAIGCRPKGGLPWTMWLRINDRLSDSDVVTVKVQADGKEVGETEWKVGVTGKTLQLDDLATIAALKTAQMGTFGWNLGWTWLWLSEEADFRLTDLPAALYLVAKGCRLPEP